MRRQGERTEKDCQLPHSLKLQERSMRRLGVAQGNQLLEGHERRGTSSIQDRSLLTQKLIFRAHLDDRITLIAALDANVLQQATPRPRPWSRRANLRKICGRNHSDVSLKP